MPAQMQWSGAVDLQDALEAAVRALAHYKATRAVSKEEAPLLQSACDALTDTLCPYIAACFSRIYPSAALLPKLTQVTAALSEQPQKSTADDAQIPQPAGNQLKAEQNGRERTEGAS